MTVFIHPSAFVEDNVQIGDNTKIWHHAQVRTGAKIGMNCVLGKGVFCDTQVSIGNNVKVQNYVSIYHGVTIADDVFIGPHAVFTNDLFPRARGEWQVVETKVECGASIGANATNRCGITLGEYCMIGAGAVVVKTVLPHALEFGNPARIQGYVCKCGRKLLGNRYKEPQVCPHCSQVCEIKQII